MDSCGAPDGTRSLIDLEKGELTGYKKYKVV
jgi:hypothetical protein